MRGIKTLSLGAALILFAGLLGSQVRPVSPVDISGANATVQIATSGSARWVQLLAPSGNAAVSRWGDSNASATRGGLLPAGSGQFFPPITTSAPDSTQSKLYDLSSIYVYVASGDKITAVWGN